MASLRRVCTASIPPGGGRKSRCLVDLSFFNALGTKKKEVSDPSSREFVLSLWLEKQVQRSGGREAKRAAVRDLEDELLHIHNVRAFRKT